MHGTAVHVLVMMLRTCMYRFALLLLLAVTPAWATPTAIVDPYPRIQPLGMSARLVPLVTIPPEQAAAPTARIQYVTPLQDGSGRLFVNDLRGVLYVTDQAGAAATPYLDLRTQNIGNVVQPNPFVNGFNGVAFHPNFAGDPTQPGYGTFYTSTILNDPSVPASIGTPNGYSIAITEFKTADPAAATFSGTSRLVMNVAGSGNNGSIGFNPTAQPGTMDYGKLYVASGQGSENDGAHQAQDLASPQGKLLRIDPARGPNGEPYTIPADNPYAGQAGKVQEVWASGLRNPQGFGWDRKTGTLYINDIGEAVIEEVNVGRAGADYGWSSREGVFATGYVFGHDDSDYDVYPWPDGLDHSGLTDPIGGYSHWEGYALGSGVLYRGTALPGLYGKYVMADIVLGRLLVFDPAESVDGYAPVGELPLAYDGSFVDLSERFGYDTFINGPRVDARLSQDADGELLLALKANGTVYRVTGEPVPEPATLALLLPMAAAAGLRGRLRYGPGAGTL